MPQTGGKGWGAIPASRRTAADALGASLPRSITATCVSTGESRHAPQPSPTAAHRWAQTRDARGLSLTA